MTVLSISQAGVRSASVADERDRAEIDLAESEMVPAGDADAGDPEPRGEVWGRVRGNIPEGTRLELVVRTLADGKVSEQVVADTVPGERGRYRLRYPRAAVVSPSGDVTVSVRARGADGALVGESPPLLSPGPREHIDLRLRRPGTEPSDFAR